MTTYNLYSCETDRLIGKWYADAWDDWQAYEAAKYFGLPYVDFYVKVTF